MLASYVLIDRFLHQAFDVEMQSFFDLFTRYLAERAKSVEMYVIDCLEICIFVGFLIFNLVNQCLGQD